MLWEGHLHRPLCGIGSLLRSNQAPRKGSSTQAAEHCAGGFLSITAPHFARPVWIQGGEVRHHLRGSLPHPSTQNTEALASWLQGPCFSSGDILPSQVAVQQGSPEQGPPLPTPCFTRRASGALSWAVLKYCLAKESGQQGLWSGFRAKHCIGCRRQQGAQVGVQDSDLGWSDCIVIIRSSKATGRWLHLVEGV